jgi:hypothetical protein
MSNTNTEEHTSYNFTYPSNAREFPKRYSPLASSWVAVNFRYNPSTGLVERVPVKDDEVSP